VAIDLIPNLETAWAEPGHSEPVSFGEYVAPKQFKTFFIFRDDRKNTKTSYWDIHFTVGVSPLGTPKLLSVEVLGNRSQRTFTLKHRDGVERWQLKVVEQYRTQLLTLALRLAVEMRPTVLLRREFDATNMAISRAITKAGGKPNEILLEHPSTITGKLPNGEVADFVRFWDVTRNRFNAKELRDLQKLIGVKIRQKITRDLLSEVADIYNEEGTRLGGKPVKAIQTRFNCSYRTAQDYVSYAREEKLLPPTTAGKVTVKKPINRKGKK
jgi:hypothetical protein